MATTSTFKTKFLILLAILTALLISALWVETARSENTASDYLADAWLVAEDGQCEEATVVEGEGFFSYHWAPETPACVKLQFDQDGHFSIHDGWVFTSPLQTYVWNTATGFNTDWALITRSAPGEKAPEIVPVIFSIHAGDTYEFDPTLLATGTDLGVWYNWDPQPELQWSAPGAFPYVDAYVSDGMSTDTDVITTTGTVTIGVEELLDQFFEEAMDTSTVLTVTWEGNFTSDELRLHPTLPRDIGGTWKWLSNPMRGTEAMRWTGRPCQNPSWGCELGHMELSLGLEQYLEENRTITVTLEMYNQGEIWSWDDTVEIRRPVVYRAYLPIVAKPFPVLYAERDVFPRVAQQVIEAQFPEAAPGQTACLVLNLQAQNEGPLATHIDYGWFFGDQIWGDADGTQFTVPFHYDPAQTALIVDPFDIAPAEKITICASGNDQGRDIGLFVNYPAYPTP